MLLSAIIPTRNRSQRLSDLLDSLARQEAPRFDWEVIVVDNASSDDTFCMVQDRISAFPTGLRYVIEPNLGLHHGRHRGAREARGTILGYLDDDVIVSTAWSAGCESIAQGRVDAVAGRTLPKWETAPPDWITAVMHQSESQPISGYLALMDLGTSECPVAPGLVFGCNFFIKKDVLFQLGGFHPDGMPDDLLRFRGDGETGLMKKFSEAGFSSLYDPRATAFHIVGKERLTIDYLCSRAFRQGISDSYTVIRTQGGISRSKPSVWRKLVSRPPHLIAKTVVNRILQRVRPEKHPEIKKKLRAAYRRGWDFHQQEASNDPALMEYVLKENYLD